MSRVGTGESVLSRAVRIFEAFTPQDTTLRVSEIAARTGLHLATASRLVAELVEHGLLARDPDRGVRIGVRMWELALRASPTMSLRDAAMPFLEDLHAVVGHHVQLGVLDGTEVLFLERLSTPGAVINYTRIAGRLPLHASSSGLVLLAHSPPQLQEQIIAGPLHRYTAQTISNGNSCGARWPRCAGRATPTARGTSTRTRSGSRCRCTTPAAGWSPRWPRSCPTTVRDGRWCRS